jgi:hypothetical protein
VTEPDPVLSRLGDGIGLSQRGDRTTARTVFAQLWDQVGADGDPLHRCGIAHSMADVQDDPHEELRWDLLALAAAQEITDERAAAAGIAGPAAGFYPSLHLNLAECYRTLGNVDLAREHLAHGEATVGALGQDGYADMIRGAFARIAEQLT